MGLVFELPLLIWLLSRLGIIDKSFLRKYRRHAIVILLVLAAIGLILYAELRTKNEQ